MAEQSNPKRGRNRWVTIEHDFIDNPKVLRVGAAGAYAHLAAIIYSARHLTNGFVPDEAVWQIMHADPVMDEASKNGLLDRLLESKLWHRQANGYQIHDYLEYQTDAEAVAVKRLAIRNKRAEAGRKGGLARQAKAKQTKQIQATEVEVEVEVEQTPEPAPAPEAKDQHAGARPNRNGAGAGAGGDELERLDPKAALDAVLHEGTP